MQIKRMTPIAVPAAAPLLIGSADLDVDVDVMICDEPTFSEPAGQPIAAEVDENVSSLELHQPSELAEPPAHVQSFVVQTVTTPPSA